MHMANRCLGDPSLRRLALKAEESNRENRLKGIYKDLRPVAGEWIRKEYYDNGGLLEPGSG